jgi:hypothetical protein
VSSKLKPPGPVVLGVLYVAAFSTLALWLSSTETWALKNQLAVLTPSGLQICFLLLLCGGWLARKAIARSFGGGGLIAFPLFILAFVIVSTLPPSTHRIYFDEDIYQNVAQNILWSGKAQMCNEGVIEHGAFECLASEYNKEPNAFPFLLSLVFRLTGVDEAWAHTLNRLIFSLGALCAFWVGQLIFRDRWMATSAGVLYLLTPENLLWGATVAVEPGAATFAGLALGAWLLFLKETNWTTSVFAAAAVAFASQWRPESVLIIPLVGFATLFLARHQLRKKQVYVVGLIVLVLLLPHLGHLWAVRGEGWGSTEAGKFSWDYVPNNLKTNATFYVQGKEYPVYFTLLALLGLVAAGRWREKGALLFWFLFFFGIFIPFHAGSYRYGADIRFSLLTAMPLALLGGLGSGWLGGWLQARSESNRWVQVVPMLGAIYFFTGFFPMVRAIGREAWAARADHDIVQEMLEKLPEGSIVLTHNPGMLQVMGRSAVQTSVVTYQPERADELFRRFPGGVYFHFNFWCNITDEVQNAFCNKVLETYPTQVIEDRSAGNHRYVLYRLLPKRGVPPK